VAQIPYTTIGLSARATEKIYFESNQVADGISNRGVKMYVKEYVSGDNFLQIIVLDSFQDSADLSFTITYINR
jgi:hypothetical protein